MLIALAATALVLAPDGSASTTVKVGGLDRPAALAALRIAAVRTCSVVATSSLSRAACVRETTADAVRSYDALTARAPIRVAAQR